MSADNIFERIGGFIEDSIMFLAQQLGKVVKEREERKEMEEFTNILEKRLSQIKGIYTKEDRMEEITENEAVRQRIRLVLEMRKKELKKSFFQRLTEHFARTYQEPLEKFAKSMEGLEMDLYRANIPMRVNVYLAVAILISLAFGIAGFVGALVFGLGLLMALGTGFSVGMIMFMYMKIYPRMVWKRRVASVERELPFALRHLATMLGAGVGLAEAFLSVAEADYGAFSEEARFVLAALRAGRSFEDALREMERRVPSDKVARVVNQLIRAQKLGGNITTVLYDLAEEFSHQYRTKLTDYINKVSGIASIFTYTTAIMPTMMFILQLAGGAMGSGNIDIESLRYMILVGFPAISLILVIFIQRAEPR